MNFLKQKKGTELTKNKKIIYRILGAFFIIFSILALYHIFVTQSTSSGKIALNTNQLTLHSGKYVEGTGCFTDETLSGGQSGVFASLNDISLCKATFKITVDYETDTDDNAIFFRSPTDTYGSMKVDNITLRSDKTSVTTTMWINDSNDYMLDVSYCGTGSLLIKNICIEQTNLRTVHTFSIILLCFCAVGFFYFLYRKAGTQTQKNVLFGLLIVSFAASLPLFTDYQINGLDLTYHLSRIEGLCEGMRAGMFPVKIHPNILKEHGYASPVMYGDIFLYIPALLRMLGFTVMGAYKVYVFLVNTATCFVSYLSFKKVFKKEYIGLLGCVLYTLSSYRFTNVYARAAVGEYTAMIFLPLIFCGLYLIFMNNESQKVQREGILISVIGFSGIIQTHVLTCEIVGMFTLLSCIILWKKVLRKNTFFSLAKVVIFTAFLNLWWLVPFFDYRNEKISVNFQTHTYIQARGTFLSQLFMPFTDFNGISWDAAFGLIDEMPLNIGLGLCAGMVLIFYVMFFGKKPEQKTHYAFTVFTMCMAVIAGFMTTIYFPYDKLMDISSLACNYLSPIQFPWRFLLMVTLFMSFSTCAVIIVIHNNYTKELAKRLAVLICLLTAIPYAYSVYSALDTGMPLHIYDTEGLDTCDIGTGEYLPWGTDVQNLSAQKYTGGDNVSVTLTARNYLTIQVQAENPGTAESYVELPLLYYKGYIATDDATKNHLMVSRGDTGLVHITIPANYSGSITTCFREPWYWRASEIVSLVFLVLFSFWNIYTERIRNK